MKKLADQVLDVIEGLEPAVETHLMSVLLQLRTGILGVTDAVFHPDTAQDVYDLIGRGDTRMLMYELGLTKDGFYKWMRELAYSIYNGETMERMNAINAKHGLPAFPDTKMLDNVPGSFNKPFGDLNYKEG